MAISPGPAGLKFWRAPGRGPNTPNGWSATDKSAAIVLSNIDKTATASTSNAAARSTTGHALEAAGKYYVEFLLGSAASVGIKLTGGDLLIGNQLVLGSTGNVILSGSTIGSIGAALGASDVACMAVDTSAERIWFRKNGDLWNNDAAADPATGVNGFDISSLPAGSYYLYFSSAGASRIVTLRTEVADFTYTSPSGFTSWMVEEEFAEPPVILEAAGDSYALLGNDAPLLLGHVADAGTYALIGSNAAFVAAAGEPSGVTADSTLWTADTHCVTADGRIVCIAADVVEAAVALDALDAAVVAGLAANSGAYALTGSAATLLRGHVAGVGAYALTGSAAAFKLGYVAADSAYALTGSAAVLAGGLSAGSGSYTLTGTDLSFATGIGNVTLTAAGGSYALNGSVAAFVTSDNIILAAGAGSYALSGADAVLAFKQVCAAGSYTFTGAPVALATRITADSGSYVLTGSDAELATAVEADYTLGADAGAYAITGFDASFVIVPVAEAAVGGGGGHYPRPRPFPVVGVGYGILPELWGEAHGVVGVVGQSAAQVLVRAAAVGACGQAGDAAAILKGMSIVSHGAVGARGSGEGTIVKFSGTATGRHDDDEAAVIAFLLAA